MIKKNYKGRCERRQFTKSKSICRLYNKLQIAYAEQLDTNGEITEFQCNIPLDDAGEGYTTDFLCKKADDAYRVRECVYRRQLTWPSIVRLLDISRNYWTKRGIEDWGLITEKETEDDREKYVNKNQWYNHEGFSYHRR